jgi:hypothetical protein
MLNENENGKVWYAFELVGLSRSAAWAVAKRHKQTPWPESTNELYTDRSFPAKFCTSLRVNSFVTLATQKHSEYHCKLFSKQPAFQEERWLDVAVAGRSVVTSVTLLVHSWHPAQTSRRRPFLEEPEAPTPLAYRDEKPWRVGHTP